MNRMGERYVFIIVGVGGTGSLLARDLPKLLINTDHKMLLVDGDRVERKNMKRQSYQEQDIGEYKSIALSAKINTFYDTHCEAMGLYLTKMRFLNTAITTIFTHLSLLAALIMMLLERYSNIRLKILKDAIIWIRRMENMKGTYSLPIDILMMERFMEH